MTQSSPKSNEISALLDKQKNGFAIEAIVKEEHCLYLEATIHWLEENSIPESQFNKFIPAAIIEKIMAEALEENFLRPSVKLTQRTNTLDFLL